MASKRKQNWGFNVSDIINIQPSLYELILLYSKLVCKRDFNFLISNFFASNEQDLQNNYKILSTSGELTIAKYTKDVADTKLSELNLFIKEHDLHLNFITRKEN
jgi:hypothetical protein